MIDDSDGSEFATVVRSTAPPSGAGAIMGMFVGTASRPGGGYEGARGSAGMRDGADGPEVEVVRSGVITAPPSGAGATSGMSDAIGGY